ncbi:hypothetical protein [Paenibacillus mendelii]|uniref:Fe/B12 periplasmic-binding domain-containing protein n=1 Tax=Paenibacillus mendelii TaxID=206163 RepID=A0ABV6JG45_9BACL|nr:hypothetical protein [Paenibacillus mendelii]MCQ6557556.1 hypothetical protein [Paenibacillus mendelii]
MTINAEGGGDKRATEVKQSGIWDRLPAVKAYRVYEVDIRLFGPGDPISLNKQLDLQVEMLQSGGGR